MRESLIEAWPGAGQVWPEVAGPVETGGIAPLDKGVITMGTPSPASYGEPVSIWRQGVPRASFRQRIAGWRTRNWRRAVLAWFVLTLAIMALAAEPSTDFPKAQAGSVPAVRMVLRGAEMLTVAGVPVLLIFLP
jgi:hypothetical protein